MGRFLTERIDNMKKDRMRNFSFALYGKTRGRYIEFKESKKLTHDEAIKLLLDVCESVEKQKESEDK